MTDTPQTTCEHKHLNKFVTYLNEVRPSIESTLQTYFADKPEACEADLGRYLYEPLRAYTKNAGKRTRPALCLLACSLFSEDGCYNDAALACACAIENFQSAALIHDDIADRSTLRRGEPCLHITHGTGLAINCGDLAMSSVCGDIIQNDAITPELKLVLLDELYTMTKRTIEGQALDLGWAQNNRWDITADDYLVMATLKTAHYSAATPLVCGALCAGANPESITALRQFGIKTGLAFQLQDDLLNLFSQKTAHDKDFRSDICEGKRTYLVLYALEHLNEDQKQELIQILNAHTTDANLLERACQLIELSGAKASAEKLAQDLCNQAKQQLSCLDLSGESREYLLAMANFFVQRTK